MNIVMFGDMHSKGCCLLCTMTVLSLWCPSVCHFGCFPSILACARKRIYGYNPL